MFPDDFAWGAATASYQIEGGRDADGKGPSVWDAMSAWPGKINNADHGRVACDHYHRSGEDVAVMREIGFNAYRFSLSWPRILPEGEGKVNEAGLAFYDRLVDQLLDAGIEPWVTLFHWDYPLALYRRGGWLNPRSPEWFARYAEVVVDRLSDRVSKWMTLNEPQCFIGHGHRVGVHAPGLKLDWPDVLVAAHHALLAHGRAVSVIRERARNTPTVGWAPVGVVKYPADNDPAHVDAARAAMFRIDEPTFWTNTWFSDPVVLGRYPEDGLRVFGDAAPKASSRDFDLMCQPLDFYGANIYNGLPVRADDQAAGPVAVDRPQGYARTMFDWPIEPDCLYWGPKFLHERYGLPIAVTENGMSGHDWVAEDGEVHDPHRIDFTRRYLRRLRDAAADGVPVRGYMHWSLMDNFEWAEGYRQRFGLVHVDYATQTRTIKQSGHWYRGVIETNGRSLNQPEAVRTPIASDL